MVFRQQVPRLSHNMSEDPFVHLLLLLCSRVGPSPRPILWQYERTDLSPGRGPGLLSHLEREEKV